MWQAFRRDASAESPTATVRRRTQGGEPRPGGNTKPGSPGDWTPGARCEPRRCPALYGCARSGGAVSPWPCGASGIGGSRRDRPACNRAGKLAAGGRVATPSGSDSCRCCWYSCRQRCQCRCCWIVWQPRRRCRRRLPRVGEPAQAPRPERRAGGSAKRGPRGSGRGAYLAAATGPAPTTEARMVTAAMRMRSPLPPKKNGPMKRPVFRALPPGCVR